MRLQWGRIVLCAFVMESALIAIAVPLFMTGHGDVNYYVIPPACFVLTYLITVWIGRGFTSRFVLQGALVGVVGTLMYVALTRGQPEPWQYLVGHVLKMLGGALAGRTLGQRQATARPWPCVWPFRCGSI